MKSHHNKFLIVLPSKPHLSLIISSSFDSGNLQSVKLILPNTIIVSPSYDPFNSNYSHRQSTKTFFHFSVKLVKNQRYRKDQVQSTRIQQQQENQEINIEKEIIKIRFVIQGMKILQFFLINNQEISKSFSQDYHICTLHKSLEKYQNRDIEQNEYVKQSPEDMKLTVIGQQQCYLSFSYNIIKDYQIFFAYHYPYSYSKLIKFLSIVQNKVKQSNLKNESIKSERSQTMDIKTNFIYYCNQVLIQSLQRRAVNLLTLTSVNYELYKKIQLNDTGLKIESNISKSLFPYYDSQSRAYKFDKPYIFISCRVHPGQTSSSYALEGLIDYLISENRQQAQQILKLFVIIIVPMVNPDGVYHGYYRMDTLGHNLNRFYNSAQSHKQPSIFAIQTVLNHYSDRIIAYMDFHSHPHPNKPSFIYGNSFNSVHEQTQSQLYAKFLSKMVDEFSYQHCSFSPLQMASKDVNQIMTKQGCGRVHAFKLLNKNGIVFPHCYTIEIGYHGYLNKKGQKLIFTQKQYKKLGQKIIISLYEIYLLSQNQGTNDILRQLRQQICKQIYQKQQRFRLIDQGISKKIKNIHSIIQNEIYKKIFMLLPNFETDLKLINDKRYSIDTKQTNKQKSMQKASQKRQTSIEKKIIFQILPQKNKNQEEEIDDNNSSQFKQQLLSPLKFPKKKSLKDQLSPFCDERFNEGDKRLAKMVKINFSIFPKLEGVSCNKVRLNSSIQDKRKSAMFHKKQPQNTPTKYNVSQSKNGASTFIQHKELIIKQKEESLLSSSSNRTEKCYQWGQKQVKDPMNVQYSKMMFLSQEKQTSKSKDNGNNQKQSLIIQQTNFKGKRYHSNDRVCLEKDKNRWLQSRQAPQLNGPQESTLNLPKIACKTQSLKRKFDYELKMRKKYEQEYNVQMISKSTSKKKKNLNVFNFIQKATVKIATKFQS